MTHRTRRFAPLALLLLGTALGGCNATRMTQDDRDAAAGCRAEADRVYAARHRDEISQRDSSSEPFSANTLPYNPGAGLSDKYEGQQMMDTCLARGAAGPALVPGSTPSHP